MLLCQCFGKNFFEIQRVSHHMKYFCEMNEVLIADLMFLSGVGAVTALIGMWFQQNNMPKDRDDVAYIPALIVGFLTGILQDFEKLRTYYQSPAHPKMWYSVMGVWICVLFLDIFFLLVSGITGDSETNVALLMLMAAIHPAASLLEAFFLLDEPEVIPNMGHNTPTGSGSPSTAGTLRSSPSIGSSRPRL